MYLICFILDFITLNNMYKVTVHKFDGLCYIINGYNLNIDYAVFK